ncbi:MAG: hypothetical protein V3U76_20805 [Granulosicoccus sp.]
MFVILLKFSTNKDQAGQFMEGHNAWIQQGIEDGVFLLVGSLQPSAGGAIVAHDISLPDLQSRLRADPFVVEKIVSTEVLDIRPTCADDRLKFLIN